MTLIGCDESETAENIEICNLPTDNYAANMERAGEAGLFDFVLMENTPAPPDKGDNVLMISVAQEGVAIEDATVSIWPFMPEHGHGTAPEQFATTPGDEPGTYISETIDLFMGGVWEYRVEATDTDARSDAVTFTFCVQG